MVFRFLLKIARYLLMLLVAAVLVFCLGFAILQSKWGKALIQKKLISNLQKMGIPITIVELEGELPFTWKVKELTMHFDHHQTLTLTHLQLRLAILSLLKGQLAINYLKAEQGSYSFLPPKEEAPSLALSEVKTKIRKQLARVNLPFPIYIDHFGIDRFELIDLGRGSQFVSAATGKIALQRELREFALDLNLFSPHLQETYTGRDSKIGRCQGDALNLSQAKPAPKQINLKSLSMQAGLKCSGCSTSAEPIFESRAVYLKASLAGSEKKDWVSSELSIHMDSIPTFISPDISGNVDAQFSLKGPWTSFREILYELPLSKKSLEGFAKGRIFKTHSAHMPFLNRDWKFKAHFHLTSDHEAYVHNLSLLSDLLHVKGKAELSSLFEQCKAALCFSSPDLSLLNPYLPFPLAGSSQGKALIQEGQFKIAFETRDLLINAFAAESTRGLIKGEINTEAWNAEVTLASSNATLPFQTSFVLALTPHKELSISDFVLASGNSTLQGHLNYSMANALYEGSFFARIEDLEPFSSLLNEENLAGKIDVELLLSPNNREQHMRCALTCKNMRYRETLVDDLSFSTEIDDLFHSPEGRCHLLAEKIYTPAVYLDRLLFGTYSDENHWPFYMSAEGRIENPLACDVKGFWAKENSLLTLELTELKGRLAQIPFALKYPCEIEWGAAYLNLSPVHFKMGEGSLFTTFELSPVRSLGKWEVHHFPLELLSCIRPRFALSGFVSSSGSIDATAENAQGVFNAAIEQADILHFGKKEPVHTRGSIQAHLDHHKLQIHAALFATDAQFLDFNATLPAIHEPYPLKMQLDPTKNTSAELLAEGKLQDLFDFVNLGTNYFTGLLSCRLFLSRTLSHPSLQGRLELQNGTYDNYFTGIALRHVDAAFEADGDTIKLTSLHANDDASGEVSMTGRLALEPEKHFPYAFDAEMHNLHAVGFDMIDCNLSGPLYLTGTTQEMLAQGNLLIDSSQIHISERLPYETPSLPVTFLNTPKHLMTADLLKKPSFDFDIDLEVTSEGTVRVKGRGLNAELEGNVHLYGRNTRILANGDLKLVKGEYSFAGKVFKLTEGEILFTDKPTPSAYLNLNGTLSLPSITITAMLRGPLMAPQLSFQSNPQKPTSAILALILFNKEITEISHPEAIQLASTLVSLTGGAGPDVLESIRSSIGIDRLSFASKPGSDELAVQIGKYLTRGVMITLSQSATSSQVIVEVELPKGFIFQAETQEEEEGKFSLKWRKSY